MQIWPVSVVFELLYPLVDFSCIDKVYHGIFTCLVHCRRYGFELKGENGGTRASDGEVQVIRQGHIITRCVNWFNSQEKWGWKVGKMVSDVFWPLVLLARPSQYHIDIVSSMMNNCVEMIPLEWSPAKSTKSTVLHRSQIIYFFALRSSSNSASSFAKSSVGDNAGVGEGAESGDAVAPIFSEEL